VADPSRLYRLLLNIYPVRMREEYTAALERQFLDEYREVSGIAARLAFCWTMIRDLLVSVPGELVREFRQDAAHGFRVYSRRPVVTLLAVAALALAIGATTGVFTVVNALLIRSLPFRASDRIVQVWHFSPSSPTDGPSAFHAWRKHSRYLEDAARYQLAEMNLAGVRTRSGSK
jgi:hypothetical protein